MNKILPLFHLLLMLSLVLWVPSCGGGGGGGGGVGGVAPETKTAEDGSYEGTGTADDAMWFLVGNDGKNLMNFTLFRPPDINIDLVAPLNTGVVALETVDGERIFSFSIVQPTLNGSVQGILRDGHVFECSYVMYTATKAYSGTILCNLTLSKAALGQVQQIHTFRDISVTLGAVNILDEGWSISFGDFNKDSSEDLFMPCSPSLYRYVWGALNGLGYYLVDSTDDYGTPTDSRLYSLWTDVDSDGWNDLIAAGEIYRNISYGGVLKFENEQAYQIHDPDPEYCCMVDYNGDNDLDVFSGLWNTNRQDEDTQNQPYYELGFQLDYKVNYTKSTGTMLGAFAPLEFNPVHAVPDVDLDLIELVQEANKVLKVYRCDRGAKPEDPVTFTSDGQMPAAMATAVSMAFGDLNNDLKPDLLVIGKDPNSTKLYINNTDTNTKPVDIEFQDKTVDVFNASGLAIPIGGDVDFADYDNDGWLDFFVAAPFGETTHKLYRNTMGITQTLTFEDATAAAKITTYQPSGTYPRCTWCDLDNNGSMDLALGGQRVLLYQNAGGGMNRFLRVEPLTNIGPLQTATRAAIGAIVLVDIDQNGTFDAMRCIEAGRHNHLIAHFGLGLSLSLVDVRVYFTDGTMVDKLNVDLDMQQATPLKVFDNN